MNKIAKPLVTFLLILSANCYFVFISGCRSKSPSHGPTDVDVKNNTDMQFRRIRVSDYINKMKAAWIGQMVGVAWGAPTEFKFIGRIAPEDKVPQWKPELVNEAFDQDDLYVEMTFLRSLELYGIDISIRQAGIDFANSRYDLWHANRFGRNNLRRGIAPPDSGHPQFNKHADDIDYQIEADFAGLISPGLPNSAIALGGKFGLLMNYGDGLYGGQFVAAMYTEAFFETDMEKIVQAGLHCIPQGSQYHECISDVLTWYRQNPNDWQKTWHFVNEKYHKDANYRRFSCTRHKWKDTGYEGNIDAKLNGAYIVIGLLYGRGDPNRTIIISTRCGQDSDCNPSNAAGILFTTIGFLELPDRFISALDYKRKFSHTEYNFPALTQICTLLARKIVHQAGGRIEKYTDGENLFVIPVQQPKPSPLEQSYQPGPISYSRYGKDELAQIKRTLP